MSERTHGADLFEDGYPHGTVQGYTDGCRGGACPTGIEFGLSCKRAKMLAAGDYRYSRLVAEGKTPAEIAAIIDDRTTPTTAAPSREETPAMTEPTPAPKPAPPKKPLTATPVAVNIDVTEISGNFEPFRKPTPLSTDKYTKGLSAAQKRARLTEIRDWCRRHGFPGVPSHGRIPQDALAAYDDAYEGRIGIGTGFTDTLDEACARATEPEPIEAEETIADSGADETPDTPTFDDNEAIDALHTAIATEISDKLDADLAAQAVIPVKVQDNATAQMNAIVSRLRARSVTVGADLDLPETATDGAQVDTDTPETDTETPESDTERPEWATVTISQDVERARSLTARIWDEADQLEEQLTQALAERDAAQRSMILALRQWADKHAELQQLRTQHARELHGMRLHLAAAEQSAHAARRANYAIAQMRRLSESARRRGKRGNR
jgi:hypothetical protein